MANQLRTEPRGPNSALEPQILDVQRAYGTHQANRLAEHIRVIYSTGGEAHEVRAAISWESLAQMRSEMARVGQQVSDDDVLGLVLAPWAVDQDLLSRRGDSPKEDELTLDFGDAPRPPAVRETLLRYGLLS